MNFNSTQLEVANRLANFASIYRKAFVSSNDFKLQFENNYVALRCFLDTYAYEHQGSAKAYPIIAEQTIEKVFQGKLETISSDQSKEAWLIYNRIARQDFNGLKTNPTHNPMNSDQGVLSTMIQHNVSNIAKHVKELLANGETKTAHHFVDDIKGIGTKIASFYLRDIAYLSGLEETIIQDSHYLQPLDTWLEQTFLIIFNKEKVSLEDKQRILVELCEEAKVSPIAFNQGAWVLGSQIAEDYNTFKKIALGEDSRSTLLQLIADEEVYLRELKEIASKIQ